jgi:predicted dehydrogenase
VYEFERALAMVDIAAMEPQPTARRFEVYGTRGSAILDPMEPSTAARLVLDEPRGGYEKGHQLIPLAGTTRQRSYELELDAFIPIALGQRPPDRPLEHEVLVQETLLRATGSIRADSNSGGPTE